jgi:hypothetical protein
MSPRLMRSLKMRSVRNRVEVVASAGFGVGFVVFEVD